MRMGECDAASQAARARAETINRDGRAQVISDARRVPVAPDRLAGDDETVRLWESLERLRVRCERVVRPDLVETRTRELEQRKRDLEHTVDQLARRSPVDAWS